jgi:hypothetical protein
MAATATLSSAAEHEAWPPQQEEWRDADRRYSGRKK